MNFVVDNVRRRFVIFTKEVSKLSYHSVLDPMTRCALTRRSQSIEPKCLHIDTRDEVSGNWS